MFIGLLLYQFDHTRRFGRHRRATVPQNVDVQFASTRDGADTGEPVHLVRTSHEMVGVDAGSARRQPDPVTSPDLCGHVILQ